MTRTIDQNDFLAATPEMLSAVGKDAFVIQEGEKFVAALIGEEDFEELRRKRGARAIAALNRLSDAIAASGATEEELRELEKALDRKA